MPRFTTGLKLFLAAAVMGAVGFVSSAAEAQWRWSDDGDLWFVGNDVMVEESIDGDLFVLGRKVRVLPGVEVAGDAWLSGRSVEMEGTIGGTLDLRAHKNVIGGTVNGDVSVRGESLTVFPNAWLGGDIVYSRGTKVTVSPQATVGGELRESQSGRAMSLQEDGDESGESEESGGMGMMAGMEMSGEMMAPIMMMLLPDGPGRILRWMQSTMFLLVVLVSLAAGAGCPGVVHRMTEDVRRSPVRIIVYGALWLLGVPAAAMLLAMTIIGVPLAMTLCLIWLAGLFAGMVATVLVVGKMLMKQFLGPGDGSLRRHLAATVVGLAVVIGLTFVPILEAVVWVVVALAGPGLLLRRMELGRRAHRV